MLVYKKAEEWAFALDLDLNTETALKLAALFHDVGYRTDYDDHESEGIRIFKHFAEKRAVDITIINQTSELIGYTRKEVNDPTSSLAETMHDMDRVSMGMPSFIEVGLSLRKEWEHFKGLKVKDNEWYAFQVEYLERTEFKTGHGINRYNGQRLKNLEILKRLLRQ